MTQLTAIRRGEWKPMSNTEAYEELAPKLGRVRVRVMKLLWKHPEGLSYERVHSLYDATYGHKAKTDNRLRELVSLGWAERRLVSNRMTFFAKQSEGGDTNK